MKKNLSDRIRKLKIGHWRLNIVTFPLLLVVLLTSCNSPEAGHEHDTYTCPMHPTVISDRPGTCPVCGMDLVRKARPGEEVEITEGLAKLLKSPNEAVVASVNTIKGQYKSLPVTVNAQGVVTYDTRGIATIPARVGGRLEKVYLKYEFQPVTKGQKVADIYSPELSTAQRELVFLLENDPDNKGLINAARKKLRLLGMTDGQINVLSERKQATNTITVYSEHSGYLITGEFAPSQPVVMSAPGPAGGMNDGMGNSPAGRSVNPQAQTSTDKSIVREGDYVVAGQTLATVASADAVRIELNLPGQFTGKVEQGSKVQLDLGDGMSHSATIDFIQPFFSEGQEFMKLRVYTSKTDDLHIGHLVNAKLRLDARESLWVPKEAVLDLGIQKVVFVKDRGMFKPKQVSTGINTEGMVEIKNGLASSDEIAGNAQYLVDSESFIKPVK